MPATVEIELVAILERIENKIDDTRKELEQKIDKLETKVDKLTEDVNEIKSDMKSFKTEIEGVKKRVDNQEFINRATTGALVTAFLITILRAVFPNFGP